MDPVSRAQNSGDSAKKRGKPFGADNPGKRFAKGQSGNPGGRPKKKPVTEMFEELFYDGVVRGQIKERIRKTMTEKGMAGVLLLREGAERVEGKVAQEVDMNVSGTLALSEIIQERRKRRANATRQP